MSKVVGDAIYSALWHTSEDGELRLRQCRSALLLLVLALFYTTLLQKLLVVEQEIVLSAAVGRLLLDWLDLTPTCEFPRKQPLFDFGDSRFSVIRLA